MWEHGEPKKQHHLQNKQRMQVTQTKYDKIWQQMTILYKSITKINVLAQIKKITSSQNTITLTITSK